MEMETSMPMCKRASVCVPGHRCGFSKLLPTSKRLEPRPPLHSPGLLPDPQRPDRIHDLAAPGPVLWQDDGVPAGNRDGAAVSARGNQDHATLQDVKAIGALPGLDDKGGRRCRGGASHAADDRCFVVVVVVVQRRRDQEDRVDQPRVGPQDDGSGGRQAALQERSSPKSQAGQGTAGTTPGLEPARGRRRADGDRVQARETTVHHPRTRLFETTPAALLDRRIGPPSHCRRAVHGRGPGSVVRDGHGHAGDRWRRQQQQQQQQVGAAAGIASVGVKTEPAMKMEMEEPHTEQQLQLQQQHAQHQQQQHQASQTLPPPPSKENLAVKVEDVEKAKESHVEV
mmetsp:Transcript_5312/g.12062  ORF Transcript_5312/g.12062 Transcript_5312/m.12062 type:complete len:341 (+) Transcript_5312:155-1177(+)